MSFFDYTNKAFEYGKKTPGWKGFVVFWGAALVVFPFLAVDILLHGDPPQEPDDERWNS